MTGEPYYEPYMDDFPDEGEDEIEEFFEKFGLKLINYDCDTYQSDYERDDDYY